MRQNLNLTIEVYDRNTAVHVLWTQHGFMIPILSKDYIRLILERSPDPMNLVTSQESNRTDEGNCTHPQGQTDR